VVSPRKYTLKKEKNMSALKPDTDQGHDLGTSSLKWGTLHTSDIQTATITTTGNVGIAGNLTVTGTNTSLQVTNLDVEDPLIKLARGNAADTIDIGFYGVYNDGAEKYIAFARDATDSKFKLLDGITSEPTGTAITGGSAATLVADIEGALTGNATTATTLASGRNFGITSGPVRAANVSFNGSGDVAFASTIAADQITNAMLVNEEITFTGDSGTQALQLGDSFAINGTSGEIVTAVSGDAITLSLPAAISGITSIAATTFTGALSGNATTATTLASAQNFSINSGPVTASAISFNGSGAVALTSAIANGAISNAMLANDGITLTVNGAGGEDINLGSNLDFNGTASQVDIAYSAAANDLTFSLPSTIDVATSGNAATASALAAAVNVGITAGPIRAANISFDGSGAVAMTSTIAEDAITNAMLANEQITFAGGSGSQALQLGDTFTINGSANEIVTAVSGDAITISLPDAVSGLASVSATSLVGALTGNASTATALASAVNVGITGGPVTAANISFDGSGAVAMTSAIANDAITNDMLANPGVTIGDGTNTETLALGGEFEIKGTTNEVDVVYNTTTNDFTIGLPTTITAAVSGNASTATALASAVNVGITGGPVTAANIAFDGSGAVAMTSAIAADAITNAMIANDHLTLATTGTGADFDIHFGDTLNINGTADEVDVSIGSDAITIGLPNDVVVANDLDVGGDLGTTGNVVVGGNLTAAAATVTLGDTLLELGVNNTATKDHGFYSQRASSSFCGFFFDETDDKFKPFTHDTEPSSDVVAVSGNYAKGAMDVGALEAVSIDCAGEVAGEIKLEGSAPGSASATGTAGDIRFDASFIYVCVSSNTWKKASLGDF
jgi:hypothetical protein